MTVEPSLHDRALGAYLGLAVGDALGATVEFMSTPQIKAQYGTHEEIIGGGWLNLRPGQVTDDTEMSLALGRVLIERRGWDLKAACDAFVTWLRGRPVDVGNTVRRGLNRYLKTGEMQGPYNEGDAGNGACMRNLPVALATLGKPKLFTKWTLEQAHITHNHIRSDVATLTLGRIVQRLLMNEGRAGFHAETDALLEDQPIFRFTSCPSRSSAYVVETMQTVLYFFDRTETFRDCVVGAVNRGDDADTTGALAGMLAGAFYGVDAIPESWLDTLDPTVKMEIKRQTRGLLALAGA